MGKKKSRAERLFGAAVLLARFRARGEAQADAFRALYQGVLEDLAVTDAEVERFLTDHAAEVQAALARAP